MKKILALLICVAMSFACIGLVSCSDSADDGVKVGLICLHGDNSTYDKNFIDAMKLACKNKGISEKNLVMVTNVEESTKCYDAAMDLVEKKCDVIFADSFGHESHMLKAAKENPSVQFCHATGTTAHTQKVANFHNAFASIYEGRYLAGVAAGMKLKAMVEADTLVDKNYDSGVKGTGNIKIGYVGAFTYAEVISGYTSFYLGVKSVIDNVVMDVQFTGSWYDEAAERTAAENLISKGSALISQHADSMGAPNACETANVPNVSYNGSTATSCPKTFIVSSRINWVPYFEYMIDCVKNKKAIDTDWVGGLENNAVVLTDFGTAAAAGTAEKIAEVKAKIEAGTLKIFDTSKFTVEVIAADADGKNGKNTNATVDENKYLTKYMADVDSDAAFTGDTNVVKDGAFEESLYRSAPYFDIQIEGIKLLNVKFG